jgi:hypothetical protein
MVVRFAHATRLPARLDNMSYEVLCCVFNYFAAATACSLSGAVKVWPFGL